MGKIDFKNFVGQLFLVKSTIIMVFKVSSAEIGIGRLKLNVNVKV